MISLYGWSVWFIFMIRSFGLILYLLSLVCVILGLNPHRSLLMQINQSFAGLYCLVLWLKSAPQFEYQC